MLADMGAMLGLEREGVRALLEKALVDQLKHQLCRSVETRSSDSNLRAA
jgi:hypothetical protein